MSQKKVSKRLLAHWLRLAAKHTWWPHTWWPWDCPAKDEFRRIARSLEHGGSFVEKVKESK